MNYAEHRRIRTHPSKSSTRTLASLSSSTDTNEVGTKHQVNRCLMKIEMRTSQVRSTSCRRYVEFGHFE